MPTTSASPARVFSDEALLSLPESARQILRLRLRGGAPRFVWRVPAAPACAAFLLRRDRPDALA